ncbi:hypothetical protein ATANTOWER_026805 [Ataeniobius toweri]|uniref:Uncharacterized protein n=1 Tax=Ataeniobius toweri TaxID=208326 RepID=A0ABU7AS28_9TELE|nr:hypothetical protein [Ataeniobius toweri]
MAAGVSILTDLPHTSRVSRREEISAEMETGLLSLRSRSCSRLYSCFGEMKWFFPCLSKHFVIMGVSATGQ